MAVDLSPSKKKSRAEYFREYRRRKSMTQEKIRSAESKPGRKTQSSTSFSLNKLQVHKIGLFFIAIFTTAYLVFVSASYLEGPLWLRICLALLSEIILLVLVTLKPTTLIDRILRSCLLLAFLIYSVLPFVTEPLKKHTDQLQTQALIKQERESLEREITHLNSEHQKLLDHDRLTKAHSVAQQLATLESQLRNILTNDRTMLQQDAGQKLPFWVLAVQRLLFVFFNLFLVHYLAATSVAQQTSDAKATMIQKENKLQYKPQLYLVAKTNYPIEQRKLRKFNIWERLKVAMQILFEIKVSPLGVSKSG